MAELANILAVLGGLGLILGIGLAYAHRRLLPDDTSVADAVEALLPQTQCAQCGYPGCRPYAEAIAAGAALDLCPPGGPETVDALARLLGRSTDGAAAPLPTPETGVARIDESRCIGCFLCVRACPVDAIVGAPQLIHTVLADRCTGCELCVAPCPVECIDMTPVPPSTEARPIRILARPRNRDADRPELPCIRCGACQPACPEALLPQELLWYSRTGAWDAAAERGLDACIECGLCNQVCPSNIDLLTHFSRGRQILSDRSRARAAADLARSRYEGHEARVRARAAEREQRRRERLSTSGQRPWQR